MNSENPKKIIEMVKNEEKTTKKMTVLLIKVSLKNSSCDKRHTFKTMLKYKEYTKIKQIRCAKCKTSTHVVKHIELNTIL